MIGALAEALGAAAYSMPQAEKDTTILDGLNQLTAMHYANCPEYSRILDGAWGGTTSATEIAQVPFLPVSIFKSHRLKSVRDESLRVTLTSSGTTGQSVSTILLDSETSQIQQRALASSLTHVLGRQRLPMLVIDTDAVFKDPRMMSARGAGVLGLMRYGRSHAFALTADLKPDFRVVNEFLEENSGQSFFIFGFTFMVWINFYEQFRDAGLDLSRGILIHSGGWKKMIERSVDNTTFRASLRDAFGITRVYNFYGMVEQIGSIFMEGPGGFLYPPNFSDVIVRDLGTLRPVPNGQPGIIQVLSLIPHSYPGHSLLTEDLGVIECVDPGTEGWMGKGVRVIGRVPRSELRGCSDVIAVA